MVKQNKFNDLCMKGTSKLCHLKVDCITCPRYFYIYFLCITQWVLIMAVLFLLTFSKTFIFLCPRTLYAINHILSTVMGVLMVAFTPDGE
jgi:membrane-anchored protein YejM (alkaline phosphatase superfamily)